MSLFENIRGKISPLQFFKQKDIGQNWICLGNGGTVAQLDYSGSYRAVYICQNVEPNMKRAEFYCT